MYDSVDPQKYSYELPAERIARYPANPRSSARMLVAGRGEVPIRDRRFDQLPEELPSGTLLVRNNTKVIPARLRLRRESGGEIEALLLEPAAASGTIRSAGMTDDGGFERKEVWSAKIRRLKRLTPGEALAVLDRYGSVVGTVRYAGRDGTSGFLAFDGDLDHLLWLLGEAGSVPLPPYIDRPAEQQDADDYQTVYASRPGAVAAPTAGLHFTESLEKDLTAAGIELLDITLHVGAGTFVPISAERLSDHAMHEERFLVEGTAIRKILTAHVEQRPIVALGTTTLRTLESLYWFGVACLAGDSDPVRSFRLPTDYPDPFVSGARPSPPAAESFAALLEYLDSITDHPVEASTRLLIAPGYAIGTVDGLITNFHQPGSTLLLLVAAFLGGNRWRELYEHALAHEYRFLSYGDGSLLARPGGLLGNRSGTR